MRCRIHKQKKVFLGLAVLALVLTAFSFLRIHQFSSAKDLTEDDFGEAIDVTITDRVVFDVKTDSNEATVSDIVVANNSSNLRLILRRSKLRRLRGIH